MKQGKKMVKLKIIHLNNNEDSLWFKLKPNMETLIGLDNIFNLSQQMPNEEIPNKISYESFIKEYPTEFLINEKRCLAYIIITKKDIQVILRKARAFEIVNEKILEHFDFASTRNITR